MGCPEVRKNATPVQDLLLFLLLLFILPTMGACYFQGHPRYQPLSPKNIFSTPFQGYKDIQIDEQTYLVLYDGYYSHSLKHGFLQSTDILDEKWLQGAQAYALHRAGELVKSKGAKYFVVLHKDDWNLIGITRSRYGPLPDISPGAGLMIRILSDYPSSMQLNDDRLYEVDKLLQSVTEKNNGPIEYQENYSPTENGFRRWRSSVSGYNSVPVPGHWEKPLWGPSYLKFESGTDMAKGSTSNFRVAIWDDHFRPTFPIQLLQQCLTLAEREGFEFFRLENWTVEEHRDDPTQVRLGRVWFRTAAHVVLQHQKELDSLDPVFVVDEIRKNVMRQR